jgi:hypothetical protein
MMNLAAAMPYLKCPWTISWIVSGLAAAFIPVIIWTSHRASYFYQYGAYLKQQDYYEDQQRYYEQQQEYYNNGNNNGNDNNYYGNNNNSNTYKQCSWLNWPCRRKQWLYATYSQQQDNNGDQVNQSVPAWYVFMGGETEEMQRWREEAEDQGQGGRNGGASSSNAGLNFAYFLTLLLFVGLVAYGAKIIVKKEPMHNLTVFLIVAVVVGFMNLILSVNAISSGDDRDMDDSYYGWYGQTAVLMAYTDFWMMLFAFAFLGAFQIKNYVLNTRARADELDDHHHKAGDYQAAVV